MRLRHRNSVRSLSITWVDQSKTVQARITKSVPSSARKSLVSGSVKFFSINSVGVGEGVYLRGSRKILRFLDNKSLYLNNGAR